MVAATASAKLIVLKSLDRDGMFNTNEEYERVNNAIRFLKLRKEVNNG